MAPRILAVVLIAAVPLTAAGCGSADEKTPAACLDGPAAYSRALRGAPAEARLAGGTPISACLTQNQSAGDLTRVGAALIAVATTLNAEARAGGEPAAARRLGYLVGAARRGASDTDGIHTNLVERLGTAAEFSPGGGGLPPDIAAAYRAGIVQGAERG
ncbi:MAG: hypothetical protein ACXWZM_02220 [Solirubrobacterales bacterium]